jgi:hypothetical protein
MARGVCGEQCKNPAIPWLLYYDVGEVLVISDDYQTGAHHYEILTEGGWVPCPQPEDMN